MCFMFDIAAGGWEAGNEMSSYEEETNIISDVYIRSIDHIYF